MGESEYDFRFEGLEKVTSGDEENRLRVGAVRSCLNKLCGGFTELAPDIFNELIPGEGMGYIVAISDAKQVSHIESEMGKLADLWSLARPSFREASKGPRSSVAFFLIPDLANTDAYGHRPPLFTVDRRFELEDEFEKCGLSGKSNVYGEWLPRGKTIPAKDKSIMYIFRLEGQCTRESLSALIKDVVYAKDCDQACIYLSASGNADLISLI